jgi:hypothetical protein
MSFDISGLPIFNLNTSIKDFFYSKEIIPLNQNYLIKTPKSSIVFKSYNPTQTGTTASVYVNLNNIQYGFEILNVPKYYTLNLGIELLNFSTSGQDLYVIDSKGNKIYLKFYIGILNGFGDKVYNLATDPYYYKTGVNISFNIPNSTSEKLNVFGSNHTNFTFLNPLTFTNSTNFNGNVNGDSYIYEIRDSAKSENLQKSFGNEDYTWYIPLSIIGLIFLIIVIIGLWMLFKYLFSNSSNNYSMNQKNQGYYPQSSNNIPGQMNRFNSFNFNKQSSSIPLPNDNLFRRKFNEPYNPRLPFENEKLFEPEDFMNDDGAFGPIEEEMSRRRPYRPNF